MADDAPDRSKVVPNFLEMFALACAFAFVDALLANKPWQKTMACLAAAILLFLLASYWPEIIGRTGGFGDLIEHFARMPLFQALALLAVVSSIAELFVTRYHVQVGRSYSVIGLAVAYIFLALLYYNHSLRRELEMRVRPRQLTGRQARRFRASLERHKGYRVVVEVGPLDEEAREYANQIIRPLIDAGWNVQTSFEKPPPNPGIRLHATGINSLKPGDKDARPILQQAFSDGKIAVHGGSGVGAGPFEVFILVGPRPLVIGQKPSMLFRLGRFIQNLGR
jgi:hypothetical protein